uniref:HDC01541 n=1 Tax=Drosophila melanogaster TaxID=7227 RepID=Q6IHQ8_DROME|nr:TPA_inf: HDC01541 [Drosophila melanogaster]
MQCGNANRNWELEHIQSHILQYYSSLPPRRCPHILFPILAVAIPRMPATRHRRGGQAVDMVWLLLPMTMSRSLMLAAAAVLVLMMLMSIQCAFTVSVDEENTLLDL